MSRRRKSRSRSPRSWSRGNSRSRSRSYSRSRSRSRSNRRSPYIPRNRNSSDEDNYGRERSGRVGNIRRNQDDGYSRRQSESHRSAECPETQNEPTHTVLLKNVHHDINESDIYRYYADVMPVKDVRVMRRKDGASRGFAFVEFHSVAEAQRWMDMIQGEFLLRGRYKVYAYYAGPKQSEPHSVLLTEWVCIKCTSSNYKRRDRCFRCGCSKEESDQLSFQAMHFLASNSDGSEQIGHNPCNTVVLRGLDALTTADHIKMAIYKQGVGQFNIRNCVVITDQQSGVSLGFAFVEFDTVAMATSFLQQYGVGRHNSLEVDGKVAIVDYSKNTFSTVMASLEKQHSSPLSSSDAGEVIRSSRPVTYRDRRDNHRDRRRSDTDRSSRRQRCPSLDRIGVINPATGNYDVFPTPDLSTYHYDEKSSYYIDPVTKLYYDNNTQLYYNAATSCYVYWDHARSTYLPAVDPRQAATSAGAAGQAADANGAAGQETDAQQKLDANKAKKPKCAGNIAKDMEKLAKRLNAQNEALKRMKAATMPPTVVAPVAEPLDAAVQAALVTSNAADAAFEIANQLAANQANQSASSAAATWYAPTAMPEADSLIDWSGLACLLCSRQFSSTEQLQRHTELSKLHLDNLTKLQETSSGGQSSLQYRDRASERRQKVGTDATGAPKPPPPSCTSNAPVAEPAEVNVGGRLMERMGWQAGRGLGRKEQGIVEPIRAERRVAQAGLGSEGSRCVDMTREDLTYKENAKRVLFSRYERT